MTFEEDFPSLKGQRVEPELVEGDNRIVIHDCVENGSFLIVEDVQKHCRDVQRIREAIEKVHHSFDNADEIICGCGCKQTISFAHGTVDRVIKDLKKELGL